MLDSGIVGQLCHPRRYPEVGKSLLKFLSENDGLGRVIVPEVVDYEVRRKLLHLIGKKQAEQQSLDRLDRLADDFDYLPLDTDTMRNAARLWSRARLGGAPTAGEASLDADVILAAQALAVDATVVTTNRKHLSRYVATCSWAELESVASDD